MHIWQNYKYKNTFLFVVSLIIGGLLSVSTPFHSWISGLGNGGYVLAFFTGMLFVSTFTISIGTVVLFWIARFLSPVEVGIIAFIGAILADVTLFRFLKDHLAQEVEDMYRKHGGNEISHILHSRYFSWSLPVIGIILIASPLNQIGISLIGISKMKTHQMAGLSFILNSVGIVITLILSRLLA